MGRPPLVVTFPRALAAAARREALLLALLVLVPLAPHLVELIRHPIPRFATEGDYSGIELAVRSIPSGTVLLGPYSRFHFSHPGPAFLYALGPAYLAFGGTTTGIFAGAWLVNALSAIAMVVQARLWSGRRLAFSTALVVTVWLAAFSNTSGYPWNALVVVLPLTAYLATCATLARGEPRAAPYAALLGMFVAETHLSTVPVVAVSAAVALALYAQGGGARGVAPELGSGRFRLALVVIVALAAPPVVEQLGPGGGNLGKIVAFFTHREAPLRPWADAWTDFAHATSWLIDRSLSASMLEEWAEPVPMSSRPLPPALSLTELHLTQLHVAAFAVSALIASIRRDRESAAYLAVGGVASALGVMALRAVVLDTFHYLVFWTTAATTVSWIGIVSTLVEAGYAQRHRLTASRAAWLSRGAMAAGALLLLSLSARTTHHLTAWLDKCGLFIAPREDTVRVYDALRTVVAKRGVTPVLHSEGAWGLAMSFHLELDKDEAPHPSLERDAWIFGRYVERAEGLAKPLHVWLASDRNPLPLAPCLTPIASHGVVVAYGSDHDVVACPPRSEAR